MTSASPYPRLAAYLAALPHGLRSYPDCMAKGSILRMFLETGLWQDTEGLPPELASHVADLPSLGGWFPETHYSGLLLATYDRYFAGTDHQWDPWIYNRNLALFNKPFYRVLFFTVLSPERLMIGTQNRWSAFRRGSSLEVVSRTETSARMRIRGPAYVFATTTIRSFGFALRAALVCAGAKLATSTIVDQSPTEAEVELRWTK